MALWGPLRKDMVKLESWHSRALGRVTGSKLIRILKIISFKNTFTRLLIFLQISRQLLQSLLRDIHYFHFIGIVRGVSRFKWCGNCVSHWACTLTLSQIWTPARLHCSSSRFFQRPPAYACMRTTGWFHNVVRKRGMGLWERLCTRQPLLYPRSRAMH